MRIERNTTPTTEPATPTLALRPREAAAALAVCERTLWQWTQAGDVPHIRRGKVLLYPVAQLEDWLARQAEGGER